MHEIEKYHATFYQKLKNMVNILMYAIYIDILRGTWSDLEAINVSSILTTAFL